MLADGHQNTVENIKEQDVESHDPERVAGHVIHEPAFINRLSGQINER